MYILDFLNRRLAFMRIDERLNNFRSEFTSENSRRMFGMNCGDSSAALYRFYKYQKI